MKVKIKIFLANTVIISVTKIFDFVSYSVLLNTAHFGCPISYCPQTKRWGVLYSAG
jgi:hypothetical protein